MKRDGNTGFGVIENDFEVNGPVDTEEVLHAVETGASDLHLKVGNVPFIRVDGALQPTEFDEMAPADTQAVANELMPEHRIDYVRLNAVARRA